MKRSTLRTIKCLALAGSTGLCLSAWAQEDQQLETAEPLPAVQTVTNQDQMLVQKQLPMQFTAAWAHQFNTHVDDGGNFSLDRFRFGLGLPLRFNDQFALDTRFKYQLDAYNFGGGLDPWGNIQTLTIASLLQYRPDEHWLWYGGPLMRTAVEENANWGNATRGGGALAVNYIADENLSFGGGLIVMGQIEDNTLVLPIFTLNWKFQDDWRLKVGMTDLATAGYGIEAIWDVRPDWQLSFGGAYHKSRFRIEGTGPTSNGVGQEESLNLTAAATWAPTKSFSATAFVGLATAGKIRLEDSGGNGIIDHDYDTAPILGLKISTEF